MDNRNVEHLTRVGAVIKRCKDAAQVEYKVQQEVWNAIQPDMGKVNSPYLLTLENVCFNWPHMKIAPMESSMLCQYMWRLNMAHLYT